MKQRTAGPLARTAVAIACLLTMALTAWTGAFTLMHWDDLWSGGDYLTSSSINATLAQYTDLAETVTQARQLELWGETLPYYEREAVVSKERPLSATATNFRYEVHNDAGDLVSTNLPDNETMDQVSAAQMYTWTVRRSEERSNEDYQRYDDTDGRTYLMVYLGETDTTFVQLDPKDKPGEYNQYGWRSSGDGWEDYNAMFDTRVQATTLTVKYGVQYPFTVEDLFTENQQDYVAPQRYLPTIATAALLGLCLSAGLLVLFCHQAGRRRDHEGIALNWQDRVPLDLYLAVLLLLLLLLFGAGDSIAAHISWENLHPTACVGLAVLTLPVAGLGLAGIHTMSVRIKARCLLRNTLLWRLGAGLGRWWKGIFDGWPLTRRVVHKFLIYLVLTVLTGLTVVLIPVYQGFVLWRLCKWARQWAAIQEGTGRIVGGDPNFKIDTDGMYPALRAHAGQLNDLSTAIGSAVEERMKSERFKAELITNVSHDLKTPLTSIINYVGLLKTTELQDPKALEYIEVLERKSQRLKKLTEDLVEASKASTGVLTVSKEKLGFLQLLTQALGEYEEKFEKSDLSPVLVFPDQEHYVEADGRHLWRIIDNLLGNCVKYAMPGTRLYLDVKSWDGQVTLAVKNISREPLNISPDQLMERFVRGEESRTTEGSGLGLSIACSLAELQGGTFRVDIDGDLFKAVVAFPECEEPTAE